MASFPLSNLLDGTKQLAVKIFNTAGELFTSNNPGKIQSIGSSIVAAGSLTASTSDQTITTTGFNHIIITNDDSSITITIGIDESSLTGTKLIAVKSGESFDDYISGTALHYSSASGTPTFRYVLR